MAFVHGFENDVFISYAHVDNLTAGDDEKGWIDQFEKNLEIELSKEVGRAGIIKIWRDRSLDGGQLFDKTIQDKINSSALFLALSSPGYFASEYCKQELRCFYKKAKDEKTGLVVRDRPRIVNILLRNIPHKDWPEEYGRTIGFRFHDAKGDDLGAPLDPKSNKFREELLKLVRSMHEALEAFSEAGPSSDMKERENGKQERENDGEAFTLFFADVPDTNQQLRKRVISGLKNKHKDFHIIDHVPPPYEAGRHEEEVVEIEKKANLSIHLLDNIPGREIEGGTGKSYPHKQAELGLQYSSSQYIWVPKELNIQNIEDDGYKNFIDDLENGTRGEADYQFVRGPRVSNSIMQGILEKIGQIKASMAPDPSSSASAILIDTHVKDQDFAFDLFKYLVGKNIQPFLIPQQDDPQKNMKFFEDTLKRVNTLIIIFGQVAKGWVFERLGEAVKLILNGNNPVKCAIYLAPPEKKIDDIKSNLGLLKYDLLDDSARNKFDPKTLDPFLNSLRSGVAQ